MDAWFAGYHPTLTAVTWIGYDAPRKLGDKETGGGLSLPVWISFMETALKNVPIMEPEAPEGIVRVKNEWYYEEFSKATGIGAVRAGDHRRMSSNLLWFAGPFAAVSRQPPSRHCEKWKVQLPAYWVAVTGGETGAVRARAAGQPDARRHAPAARST
jgi:membrane peptidoglycan carboxypeptidase